MQVHWVLVVHLLQAVSAIKILFMWKVKQKSYSITYCSAGRSLKLWIVRWGWTFLMCALILY